MRKPVDVSSVGLDFHRLPRPERICAGPRGRLRCLQRDDAQRKGDSRALRRRRPANGKAANTISSETSGAPEKESFLSLAPPLSSAEATFRTEPCHAARAVYRPGDSTCCFARTFRERMMGLEPTTFCTATGPWVRPISRSNPHSFGRFGRPQRLLPHVQKQADLREIIRDLGTSASTFSASSRCMLTRPRAL